MYTKTDMSERERDSTDSILASFSTPGECHTVQSHQRMRGSRRGGGRHDRGEGLGGR